MGRVTYESIPVEFRPLQGRHCVVISRTWKQEDHPSISVCESLLDALSSVGGSIKSYDEVFILGGEQIYTEAVKNFMYMCRRIYVTRLKTDYECDQFFPWDEIKDYGTFMDTQKTRDYLRHFISPDVSHQEYQYLNTLKHISEKGEVKPDDTGIGTLAVFGTRMEFDISKRIPFLTTKKTFYESILKELLFVISGKTDTKILEEQGVETWKGNTSRASLDDRELEYEEGDMGPGMGFQWRYYGAEYDGADKDYTNQGTDQLTDLVKGIRSTPHSRQHILGAWNVSQLSQMAVSPSNILVQFNVSGDRKYLDCQIYQRSGDVFTEVPRNIAFYSVLTYMIAHLTGLRPRKFVHVVGDSYARSNHGDQINKQLNRTPKPFPTLTFRGSTKIHTIDDFVMNSFIVEGYNSWAHISTPTTP